MALTALSTFVDSFPADPAQPDYAVQAIVDCELRNCQALTGTRATIGLLSIIGQISAWPRRTPIACAPAIDIIWRVSKMNRFEQRDGKPHSRKVTKVFVDIDEMLRQ